MSFQADRSQAGSPGATGGMRSAYLLAVILFAALAAATLWIDSRQARSQAADKALIFLVGDQMMLSQRIAILTNALREAGPSSAKTAAIDELRERIATFDSNHERVIAAVEAGDGLGDDARAEIGALLSGPPFSVDEHVRGLIDASRRFAAQAADAGAPGEATPVGPADGALAGYTQISRVLSRNADSLAAEAIMADRLLFAGTLVALALMILLIFRPVVHRVAKRADELTAARNEMAHLAAHDRLTGLRNRTFLTDHFEHMIENARRRDERVAVLHLDLDNFKSVNDTYGHMAGDHVLEEVAARIRQTVRAADLAARVGGDEFVVLLNGPGDGADVAQVAARVLEAVNQPIDFGDMTFRSGASIGISIYPDDADNPEDLLIDSDLALYCAKEAGRGCVRFFSADLREEHEQRCEIEAALRDSLRRGDIIVAYQPQVSLANARVTGIEALARWNRDGSGPVAPDVFLPIAEKSDLLDAIGRQVISSAIAQAAEWRRSGIDFGRIAINAARVQLTQEDFVEFVLGEAEKNGLPADRLSVEIVEGILLGKGNAGLSGKLRALRAAGVHVVLDDFGAGYASLTRLDAREIDRLKIDMRFVRSIESVRGRRRIVRALIDLAKGLDIAVVAEGAETIDELEMLRELGCSVVQGYGVAYPMPASQLTEWLRVHASGSPLLLQDRDSATA